MDFIISLFNNSEYSAFMISFQSYIILCSDFKKLLQRNFIFKFYYSLSCAFQYASCLDNNFRFLMLNFIHHVVNIISVFSFQGPGLWQIIGTFIKRLNWFCKWDICYWYSPKHENQNYLMINTDNGTTWQQIRYSVKWNQCQTIHLQSFWSSVHEINIIAYCNMLVKTRPMFA